MITDIFLQEITSCQKRVIKADRKKMILENRHYKNNLYLTSEDEKYNFKIFLRKSDEFIEDFSIGLMWTNPQDYIDVTKSIIMLRCQGPHDGKQELGFDIHHDFHTHEITALDVEEKRYTKPSKRNSTDLFHSFDQALFYFIEKCGIINIDDFIELSIDPNQTTLL